MLTAWRCAVHGVAVLGVLGSGLSWPLKLAACVLVLAHGLRSRAPAPTPVCRQQDGTWALPALGLERLALRPGTAVGPFWARLRLAARDGRPITVLLLKDQLDPEAWRKLQAGLRSTRPPGAS